LLREDFSLLDHVSSAAMRRQSALVIGIVLAIVPSVAEARLEGPPRVDFMGKNFASCIKASKGHPVARNLPPDIVSRICTCSANYAADRLTGEDAAVVTYGNRAERTEVLQRARAFSHTGLQICKRQHKAS
jgi:hypothetical protein